MIDLEMSQADMLRAIACSYSTISELYSLGLATERDVRESFCRLVEALRMQNVSMRN